MGPKKTFLDDAIEYSEYDYSYDFDPEEIPGIQETVNSTYEVIKADTKGYEYIVQNMLSNTIGDQTDKFLLQKIVTEIEQKGDQVIAKTKSGDNYTADYVIVTFNLGVLQQGRVKFIPVLPEWKVDSIDRF